MRQSTRSASMRSTMSWVGICVIGLGAATSEARRPAAATAAAPSPEPVPLAARRPVRPETWVSRSRFHDGGDLKLTVSATRADLFGRPQLGGAIIGVLRRGEVVSLVRRSQDGRWLLVDIGGGDVAWIEARATEPGVAQAPSNGSSTGRSEATPASVRVRAEPARSARALEAQPAAPTPESTSVPATKLVATPTRSAAPPTRAVTVPATKMAVAAEPSAREAVPELALTRRGPAAQGNAFLVGARLGVAVLGTRFTSNAQGPLTNYDGSTSAVAISVGAGWVRAVGATFRVGVDAGYSFAGGASVRALTSDGSRIVLGVQSHEVGLGVAPGVHLSALGGLELRLRLGGLLQLNLVELSQKALLPSDRVLGMTVGAMVAAPALLVLRGHPLGLGLYAGAIAPADRAQTGNLEEGTSSTTVGGQAGAELQLQLWRGLGLSASYAFSHLGTHFAGAAHRDANITTADRSSETHLATLGLTWQL